MSWRARASRRPRSPGTSRQRLGQWRERYIQLLAINCDMALTLKSNVARIGKARDLWEQRFFDAVQRSTP